MLFPLPLVPFEYYYWLDDRPAYPTAFPVELTFSGPLLRGRFAAALEVALERHPMLRALVAESDGAGPVWVTAGGREPPLDWAGEDVPIGHPDGERIDLRKNVGLRIWGRQGPAKTRVTL